MATIPQNLYHGEGQTLSLDEMNKLISTAQRHINELKNTLHQIQHDRDMEPRGHVGCCHVSSIKAALDTLRKQRDTIAELQGHIHNATHEKEACRKADNDPKFAEEFQSIVRELNLQNLMKNHQAEKQRNSTVKLKWHERFYAWVMSK